MIRLYPAFWFPQKRKMLKSHKDSLQVSRSPGLLPSYKSLFHDYETSELLSCAALAVVLFLAGIFATWIGGYFGSASITHYADGSAAYRVSWSSIGIELLICSAISIAGFFVAMPRQLMNWMLVFGGGVIFLVGTLYLSLEQVTLQPDGVAVRSWFGLLHHSVDFQDVEGFFLETVGKGRGSYTDFRYRKKDQSVKRLFRMSATAMHFKASTDIMSNWGQWRRKHLAR